MARFDLKFNGTLPSYSGRFSITDICVSSKLGTKQTKLETRGTKVNALLRRGNHGPANWWMKLSVLRPVYSDTTQLNAIRRRVKLSWVGEVSIATQLNSTQLDVELSTRSQREQLSPINERSDPVDSVCRSWRHKQKHDWLGCTVFNWVSWVELSCVAIDTTQLNVELSCVDKHHLIHQQAAVAFKPPSAIFL